MKTKNPIVRIMTPNPTTIKIKDSISLAIALMKKNDFDHLPVVDNQNILKGIISKSDLYRKSLHLAQNTTGKTYSKKVLYITPVSEIMTYDPVCVTPSQSVDFAIELLLQGDFHAVPVLEENMIIGIITSKDILEYVVDKDLNIKTNSFK